MSEDRMLAGALVAHVVLEGMIQRVIDPHARMALQDALESIEKVQAAHAERPISQEAMEWARGEAKRMGLIPS